MMLSRVALYAKHNFSRTACRLTTWFKITVAAIIIFLGTLGTSANAADADQMRQMQQIIDEQRRQIEAQQRQLEAQQKQLDTQREVLEQVQIQLGDMSAESVPATAVAKAGPKIKSATVAWGQGATSPAAFNLNYQWTKLDAFPTDIADHRGMFITSSDGDKMLRLYGSLRFRATWDDRDVSKPWTMDLPTIPTGSADRSDHDLSFDTRESRIGADVNIRDLLSIRAEFDFRGSDNELRIRHMYMRSKHWVIGKNWPVMNTIDFLPLALDYHAAGAQIGVRTDQIKYMNGFDGWTYHISLEDYKPKIDAPNTVGASSRRDFPNLSAALDYAADWGEMRVSSMLAPNKVRYDGGSQSELGWGLQFATRLNVNDSNVLKAHVHRISGLGTLSTDNSTDDMVYNPTTGSFENLDTTSGAVSIEHYWTPSLSTSVAGAYTDIDLKDFQDDLSFQKGYRALVNLIWRPKGRLDGLLVGAELEHANRTNNDDSSSNANRVNLVTWYDF